MTLYFVNGDTATPWDGSAIDGIVHSLSIETQWSDDELAAVGLYKAGAADAVPSGQHVVSASVEVVDGVPKWVNVLAGPAGADVDEERDRRRYIPIEVTTSPTGAFSINMDAVSQANIQGLATVGLYLSSAAPSQTTEFRDLANVTRNLLPSELVAMGLQVSAYIGAIYAKSWALKAMDPIPDDYADDSHWA